MAITIQTTFNGPTNYKPARITAATLDNNPMTGRKDRATVSYDYGLSTVEEHKRAAVKLAEKAGFSGVNFRMVGGWERGFIWSSYVGNEADDFSIPAKEA